MSIYNITGKFLSMFFRLILITFGIFILLQERNNFKIGWYILAIVPYLTIYFKTVFSDGISSKIRLINDFAFITFILYGKEINYLTIIFLSLPIINSPNYSGEKKSSLLYLCYIASFCIVNNFTWSWPFFGATLFLWAINYISNVREGFSNNVNKLNYQIESFLEKDLEINKTYKIYKGLMDSLNSIRVIIGFKPNISQIVCFNVTESRIYLENSSDFIWSYVIDAAEVKRIREKRNMQSSIPLEINGQENRFNFFILNESKNQEYLFLFISKEPVNNKVGIIYLQKILTSATNRISKVIGIESALKSENRRMLSDFRNKYFHIQNAEKAMHFIRNRFNTLDNFIEMSKDNISGNMDDEDLLMYKTELERLERNYKLLMERVTSILNKSDKPFSATKLENKSINYIFNLIRDIWLDYFPEFDPIIKIDFPDAEKSIIKINPDGFYILIADWISNLQKHSNAYQKVTFDETDEFYILSFANSFPPEKRPEIESLKNDFNSTERDKILQRTSYGILIMKSILEEMNVKGIIEVTDNLELVLTLKKEENENSDI